MPYMQKLRACGRESCIAACAAARRDMHKWEPFTGLEMYMQLIVS